MHVAAHSDVARARARERETEREREKKRGGREMRTPPGGAPSKSGVRPGAVAAHVPACALEVLALSSVTHRRRTPGSERVLLAGKQW